MNTNLEWSAATHSTTLLDVCRFVATEDEWETRCAAENLDDKALLKSFLDDFSECAPGTAFIAYDDRPYADPDAAILYMEARRVSVQLLERAVAMMIEHHWKAEVRQSGRAQHEQIDLNLVITLGAAIDATTIELEGVEYLDLSFRPASADRFEDILQIVRDHDSRMDPRFNTIADFRREVSTVLRKPVPDATFREAMRQAGITLRWAPRGRKTGSPSHGK